MKKEQLNKLLKPMIKECIKEVIFEDGVLSGLISEVVTGLSAGQVIAESTIPMEEAGGFSRQRVELQKEAAIELQNKRKKLEESLGGKFQGIFDNVAPMTSSPTPTNNDSGPQGPLSSYSPTDSGVDISGIMSLGSAKSWKNMI
tara:strand:- start:692 stop:1123 length:432 start_codon:yes stop_codon:yes gene_type:complete